MNTLSCLDNLVGVKDCVEYDGCGTYINSIPGITLEKLSAATDVEKRTFRKLWEEIVEESKVSFRTDFVGKMIECRDIVSKTNGGCDYDELICKNKIGLLAAWKYKLAVTFFEFLVYSSRVNSFTTILSEQAKELMKVYKEKYDSSIAQAVLFVDIEAETCCAPCGGNPKTVLWLP